MTATSHPTPRLIARLLALGFAAVSLVAVVMCAVLLVIVDDVSALVAGMRHDERSIERGNSLATTVRELSLHISHTIIEGDGSHLARYERWREQLRADLQALPPRVPASERWRLQALGERTQRMHDVFKGAALPAVQAGHVEQARALHRELLALGQQAADHADALAQATESQMAHAHVLATDATRLGLLVGGFGALLAVALSVGFTVRLRAVVLKPLVALTEAAQRFGRGDFSPRVGGVGRGELAAVGEAFDRMADELAARETRLLHNERMAAIGQLAAGVAHELNNPIGIIRGYLKTMTPDGDPATLREELAILDEEAGHCQRIAEDLLSYARSGELSRAPVEMGALLEETVRRFRESPAAGACPVQVEAAAGCIDADPVRLRQVVLNLLTNAAQAGDGQPIRVIGVASEDAYRIEVQDRGPGVPVSERARIFEPFYTQRRGGSGLGLSVCHGIVRAHRGSIDVLDAEPVGARFVVSLPNSPLGHAA